MKNPGSAGFGANINNASKTCQGDYILLLNNDTQVTNGWIEGLLDVFDRFPDAGIAGSKLIYPDGQLQEAGGLVWGNGSPWNYGRGKNASDPRYNFVRATDYCSAAALLIPQNLWKKVGGFSEEFAPAYYEDTDLAFKVRQEGKDVYYTPFSEVIHFEGKSNGVDGEKVGFKKYQDINAPKFRKKWFKDYRHNGLPDGKRVRFTKDRRKLGRVLAIDVEFPRHDNNAGGYAALQEMKLLARLGYQVSFLPQNCAYLGKYADDLSREGIECLYAPFVKSVDSFIKDHAKEFDFVYITRFGVAEPLIQTIRQSAPETKIVLCNADLHFLRELRDSIYSNSAEKMKHAEATRKRELQVLSKVDLVLSYNETEPEVILSHLGKSAKVAKCPWVAPTKEAPLPLKKREGIAFLGGFAHPPNEQAVRWFLEHVWPSLSEELPDLTFHIYGSNAQTTLKDIETPGVEVAGFAEKLSDVYEQHRIFISPLQTGAGIKGKVVEALSYGTPTVISPVSNEGISIRHNEDGLVASTPEDWVESIKSLYLDDKLWKEVSANASALCEKRFSFENGLKTMANSLAEIEIYTD